MIDQSLISRCTVVARFGALDSGLIQNIQNQLVIKYQLDLTDTAQRLLIFIREW